MSEEYVGELVYDGNAPIPTLDMSQPIVRCRDCKHAITTEDGEHLLCTFWVDRYDQDAFPCVEPDGFCAWGERRAE